MPKTSQRLIQFRSDFSAQTGLLAESKKYVFFFKFNNNLSNFQTKQQNFGIIESVRFCSQLMSFRDVGQ